MTCCSSGENTQENGSRELDWAMGVIEQLSTAKYSMTNSDMISLIISHVGYEEHHPVDWNGIHQARRNEFLFKLIELVSPQLVRT